MPGPAAAVAAARCRDAAAPRPAERGSCPLATRCPSPWPGVAGIARRQRICAAPDRRVGACRRLAVAVWPAAASAAPGRLPAAAGSRPPARRSLPAPGLARSAIAARCRRRLEAATGAGIGANAADWSALIRSVISPVVRRFHSAVSAAAGLAGTVARFGYGSLLPGGGGRCSAILPPTALCHQAIGPDRVLEQPADAQNAGQRNDRHAPEPGRNERSLNESPRIPRLPATPEKRHQLDPPSLRGASGSRRSGRRKGYRS